MEHFTIKPGSITLPEIQQLNDAAFHLRLSDDCVPRIEASRELIAEIIREQKTVYGVNTGFGILAQKRIAPEDLIQLQTNLVLSHAAGVGAHLGVNVVRLVMLLKINSLARGYSGVRRDVIDLLINMFNARVTPCVPCQGSVGASGDLAPLAHLSCAMIGIGDVDFDGQLMPASEALGQVGLEPLQLQPKEGLALLNGTQVSTALAIDGLQRTRDVFAAAMVAGAISLDAAKGSDTPFDNRLHELRMQLGQQDCAGTYRHLLAGSEIRASHVECEKVQDPYSLRCQPQVMGACLDQMRYVAGILEREANAVSDNPIVFAEQGDVLSGGNFHAEPIALAADALAVAIAEIGSLSERRIALLVDHHLSGLPPFLVSEGGVNSGFMIAQVTAAALASENKSLAHPASVDSLPTSANQEDHVSMATYAARRLAQMAENTTGIVAIELLAAAQGVDFHSPLRTSPALLSAYERIRSLVPHYDHDRPFDADIRKIKQLIFGHFFCDDRFQIPQVY